LITAQGMAANLYVAPDGADTNAGTINHPLATLMAAQDLASAGDTVYLRGGTYQLQNSDIASTSNPRAYVHHINKDGIRYVAYPGEQPILDFSEVKPAGYRVVAFYVTADDCVFEGFDVVGVQVTVTEDEASNTQSVCFRVNGGNGNRFERLAMHDGMGIGFYLAKGADNLVLNCDAYNNCGLDAASIGNVDGFGCHPNSTASTGNRFVGCRAWFNSDDGFDLISANAPVEIENCWAFYNGYDRDFNSMADGNGFKAGGYGRNGKTDFPTPVPRHAVRFCLAVGNKSSGFYANHHTGGIDWVSNTAIGNRYNFNLLSTLLDNATDVDGYDHYMRNNLGYDARDTEVANLDEAQSDVAGNYFTLPVTVSATDFVSLDESLLTLPRQADGSLPNIAFARLSAGSDLIDAGLDVGFPYHGNAPDLGAFETGSGPAAALKAYALGDGSVSLEWTAPAGWSYEVVGTANLAQSPEHWTQLQSGIIGTDGTVEFSTASPVTNAAGYYRLLLH